MSLMLRRLWIQLTADRKRFGLLCAMLGVGLLLWARIIVISNVPRTVAADPDAKVEKVRKGDRGGPATAASRGSQKPIVVTLANRPGRDPFVISPTHFPKPTPDAGIGKEPAKSAVEPADNSMAREAAFERQLLQVVEQLKLEAVMSGVPMAVISGRTYRVGDEIPAGSGDQFRFTLVDVRQRSVVVAYGERRYELQMSSPRLQSPR